MGAPQVLRIPTGWTLPLRSLKTQTNYHLPMTQILLDGTAEEVNVESLAGMLDDLYNGETFIRKNPKSLFCTMDRKYSTMGALWHIIIHNGDNGPNNIKFVI